jgi:hypothetical protein
MSDANILQVPQDILDSARLTISELRLEMAVYLVSASLYQHALVLAKEANE